MRLHAIAYPGTSVLRQWVELENTGTGKMTAEATPWGVAVQADASFPGGLGTTPAGQALQLLTPLSGVAPQALTISLIGTSSGRRPCLSVTVS